MINRRLIARITVGLVPVAAAVALFAASNSLTVKIRDDCDPVTFTAAGHPCIGHGETTVPEFNAELAKEGKVDDWEFTPDETKVETGGTVKVTNRGGETHTFTKVAAFGGGFVPPLNAGKTPTPECLAMTLNTFVPSPTAALVPAGMTMMGPTAGTPGLPNGKTTKFQCCIHPWMRTEIEVK